MWAVGKDGACWQQRLTVTPTVDSRWVLSPQPGMMLIRPSDTAQSLSHASGSGHICVFKYDRLAAVRGSHPSSPVPHRVTLTCGPAKAVMSGLCLPPASWLHGLCFGSGPPQQRGDWEVVLAGVGQRGPHARSSLLLGLPEGTTPLDASWGVNRWRGAKLGDSGLLGTQPPRQGLSQRMKIHRDLDPNCS